MIEKQENSKKIKKKLNIIHPIFRIKGGAEKVIIDMSLWASSYDVEVFTFFNDAYLKKLGKYTFVSESADKLFMSNLLGFKANPFINSLIKKLGKELAHKSSENDIFLFSNFPASIVFYEATKIKPELKKAKTIFLCFEPDRLLYYKESKKSGYLPKELYSPRYHVAAFLINYWKKHDYEVVQSSNIITLSKFVNEQVEKIYDKKAVKAFEHYTYLFDQKKKEEGLKNINQKFDLNIQKDELVFLSLGRLEHGKGIEQLIDIFKELLVYENKNDAHQNIKQLRLIIGGRGSLSNRVTELTKGESKINYLGFIPDENMRDIYSISDIFVFLGEKETGGPLTVIEAMGNNLAVLVPDDGGAAFEIIEDEKNGFVTSLDKDSIKVKIKDIIKLYNAKKLDKIKANARLWVEKNATREKAKADFLSYLKSV